MVKILQAIGFIVAIVAYVLTIIHVLLEFIARRAINLIREKRFGGSKPPQKHLQNRPPVNAEYVLYLLLSKDEKEAAIGDLNELHGRILVRFNKRRADIWYYKQVVGSLWPLLRRAIVKIGALVWLGRVLRRLIP